MCKVGIIDYSVSGWCGGDRDSVEKRRGGEEDRRRQEEKKVGQERQVN
jgi:hypothetical protein